MEQILNMLHPIISFLSVLGKAYMQFVDSVFIRSNTFNFLLFIGFFIWLFIKIDFSGFLSRKRQEIIDSIKKSEEDKLLAKENLEKTRDSLKNIDEDVQKIIDDGKNTANLVKKQAEEKVIKEIKSIEDKTKKQFEANENKVKNEISKSVVSAAIAISKQHIISSLDEKTQKELIYKFIDELDNIEVKK